MNCKRVPCCIVWIAPGRCSVYIIKNLFWELMIYKYRYNVIFSDYKSLTTTINIIIQYINSNQNSDHFRNECNCINKNIKMIKLIYWLPDGSRLFFLLQVMTGGGLPEAAHSNLTGEPIFTWRRPLDVTWCIRGGTEIKNIKRCNFNSAILVKWIFVLTTSIMIKLNDM